MADIEDLRHHTISDLQACHTISRDISVSFHTSEIAEFLLSGIHHPALPPAVPLDLVNVPLCLEERRPCSEETVIGNRCRSPMKRALSWGQGDQGNNQWVKG